MPQKALLGGIGAVGSAMARFFHPREKIHDTCPQDDKSRVEGVLVVDEGIRKIRHKDHMCYLVPNKPTTNDERTTNERTTNE
jgi:hypothetical protein